MKSNGDSARSHGWREVGELLHCEFDDNLQGPGPPWCGIISVAIGPWVKDLLVSQLRPRTLTIPFMEELEVGRGDVERMDLIKVKSGHS